jgi:hypothetical protein
MKYFTMIVFLVLTVCIAAAELQELDPSKPIYQKQWGGVVIAWPAGDVDEVRMPDPKTIEDVKDMLEKQDLKHQQDIEERTREHQLREYNFGGWMKVTGWSLLALGAVLHALSSVGTIKIPAHYIIGIGAAAILAGFGVQKMVRMDQRWGSYFELGLLFVIVSIGGYGLYRARDWSVSHLIKKKKA